MPKVIMGLMSTNHHKTELKKILEEQVISGSQLESIGDVSRILKFLLRLQDSSEPQHCG